MDNLRTELDKLDGERLDYVFVRSRSKNKAEAFEAAGISKSTFYNWDDNAKLEELANELRRNRHIMAQPKLEEAVEGAVTVLTALLEASSDTVKLNAAKEILDRVMGKPTTKIDLSGSGMKMYGLVSPDEWDDDDSTD